MNRVLRAILITLGALTSQAALAATYVVTNVLDSGPGSLREAILDANANPGPDDIHFAVGSGLQTIALTQILPDVTGPVVIDGRTQPGYAGTPLIEINGALAPVGQHGLKITGGNSDVYALAISGFLAQFLLGGGHGIVLEGGGTNRIVLCHIGTNPAGTAAVANAGDGIRINNSSENSIGFLSFIPTVVGNVISGNGAGVRILSGDHNSVVWNLIGVSASGLTPIPNSGDGVAIHSGNGNRVGDGGTMPIGPARNVISGNGGNGVFVQASGNLVIANRIGWSADGGTPIGNASDGIELNGASGSFISANIVGGNGANGILLISGANDNVVQFNSVGSGGVAGGENVSNGIIASAANANTIRNNVVGGNGTNGIRLRSGAASNIVRGNFVGIDGTGTIALPNVDDGIEINDGAANNVVGGAAAVDANVVGYNGGNGILITDATAMGNVILGNFVGSRSDLGPAPNTTHGIAITNGANGNTIGGLAPGAANKVFFNGGVGVFVESGTGNAIRGNHINLNTGLGIDLAPLGINPNDPLDPDLGPNLQQNFPILNSAIGANGQTTITGTLSSLASDFFQVDFYASGDCDASGHGEGGVYLGSTMVGTDAAGEAAINVNIPVVSPGKAITATASDDVGNTSEFSPCIFTPLPVVSDLQPDNGPAAGGTPFAILGQNFQTGATVTIGGVAAANVTVNSPTSIAGETPALTPGTLNTVAVVNPDGQAGTLPNGFLADFTDVPQAHGFHDFVERIFRAGVTAGCGSGLYCVDQPVARDQMAVFLLIAKNGSSYVPPPATGTVFLDVPASAFAAAFIEALFAASITGGCGGGNYCPLDPVTRAQMSVLILRTLEGPSYNPPPATGTEFLDVPANAFAAAWIEEMAARGITSGCGGGNFCPDFSTTRGQMAVFLAVAFML